ncbi:uncharacterized protein FMAN_07153 [Fusarium mangiferae]|uniref:Uncharacterized protein n=1 Tax=Fusarium mangiferae TaxID=192010 RepID=A0A1L7T0D1_FUSMA|nr:uncharacterized protein FMAN_07153 [Fusarium mangiferae]CVK92210.1 uncharacterized protein FMAN_07153 [Fusarium mangiferae]
MSFTVFPELPSDHLDKPTAHFAEFLAYPVIDKPLRLKVTSNEGLNVPPNPLGTYTILMETCDVSEARTREMRRQWQASKSKSFDYMDFNKIGNFNDMHFSAKPNTWAGKTRETIDASNDLLIICRLYDSTAQGTFPSIKFIGAFWETDHVLPASRRLPLQAIDPGDPFEHPNDLLRRFPRLRVLYIIVKPQDLIIEPKRVTFTTNYYRDYIQTENQVPPKTFNARQRIYYEVPRAIVKMYAKRVEGIYSKMKEASIAMRTGRDLPPLVIRVMTWKNAPGVRGRFDRD